MQIGLFFKNVSIGLNVMMLILMNKFIFVVNCALNVNLKQNVEQTEFMEKVKYKKSELNFLIFANFQ